MCSIQKVFCCTRSKSPNPTTLNLYVLTRSLKKCHRSFICLLCRSYFHQSVLTSVAFALSPPCTGSGRCWQNDTSGVAALPSAVLNRSNNNDGSASALSYGGCPELLIVDEDATLFRSHVPVAADGTKLSPHAFLQSPSSAIMPQASGINASPALILKEKPKTKPSPMPASSNMPIGNIPAPYASEAYVCMSGNAPQPGWGPQVASYTDMLHAATGSSGANIDYDSDSSQLSTNLFSRKRGTLCN